MAKKEATTMPPLTPEQVAAFQATAKVILDADTQQAASLDYDARETMLCQLWTALSPEDYERFAGIIKDAADPDERCPK